jgi:CheY-like chemotaxis protein
MRMRRSRGSLHRARARLGGHSGYDWPHESKDGVERGMSQPERLRILYVDDEPVNTRLIEAVIQYVLKRPDQVITANSGQQGLTALASGPFDVVVSDQRMPGMNGTSFLEHVRVLQPDAVRVIVTGYTDDPEVRAAAESGLAEAVIAKPWRASELYATLRAALGRRRGLSGP